MIRALFDTGVLISALLSPTGSPARLLTLWVQGHYELVVSSKLLDKLDRVLRREKFRRYLTLSEAARFVSWLGGTALGVPDPSAPAQHTADPNDDYLIAAARAAGVPVLVSGDRHLLAFAEPPPVVMTPAAFLRLLRAGPG